MAGSGIDEQYGGLLKSGRCAAGVSQDDLANALQVAGFHWNQSTVSKVEAGTRPVKLAEAVFIADLLGPWAPSLNQLQIPRAHRAAITDDARTVARTVTSDPDTTLMTVDEVAAILRVGRKTLLNWRPLGIGPRGFRVGGSVRYERADVMRWLAEQRDAEPQGVA